jgi:hypothetical protein
MIEIELRNILVTIPELTNKVFMLTAPELTDSPYCVYTMNNDEETYTLDGTSGNRYLVFDINVYSKDTYQLKIISYKVKDKLLSLLGTTQGAFVIESVKTRMIDFYDSMVEMYRAVIELEFYIKEV